MNVRLVVDFSHSWALKSKGLMSITECDTAWYIENRIWILAVLEKHMMISGDFLFGQVIISFMHMHTGYFMSFRLVHYSSNENQNSIFETKKTRKQCMTRQSSRGSTEIHKTIGRLHLQYSGILVQKLSSYHDFGCGQNWMKTKSDSIRSTLNLTDTFDCIKWWLWCTLPAVWSHHSFPSTLS